MSVCRTSLDGIYLKLNNEYLEALKKDIEEAKANPDFINNLSAEQKEIFSDILNDLEDDEDILNDMDSFITPEDDTIKYYDYDANEAKAWDYNLKTGKLSDNSYHLNEFVYCISDGIPNNLFKPVIADMSELIQSIQLKIYIPTNFDFQNNVIFMTGVEIG
jgi:hypothetical protein